MYTVGISSPRGSAYTQFVEEDVPPVVTVKHINDARARMRELAQSTAAMFRKHSFTDERVIVGESGFDPGIDSDIVDQMSVVLIGPNVLAVRFITVKRAA